MIKKKPNETRKRKENPPPGYGRFDIIVIIIGKRGGFFPIFLSDDFIRPIIPSAPPHRTLTKQRIACNLTMTSDNIRGYFFYERYTGRPGSAVRYYRHSLSFIVILFAGVGVGNAYFAAGISRRCPPCTQHNRIYYCRTRAAFSSKIISPQTHDSEMIFNGTSPAVPYREYRNDLTDGKPSVLKTYRRFSFLRKIR